MENNKLRYDNELQMNKLDGVYAILMIGYTFFSTYVSRYIIYDSSLWKYFSVYFSNELFGKFLFCFLLGLFQIFPIFIILKCRKQDLKSIGINKDKILRQIIIAIICYLPLFLLDLILIWKSGFQFNIYSISIWNFLYMLIDIALVEEIIFRGFIQQRLKGLIKNKYLNLIVVAFIFSIMHIPFMIVQNNITFYEVVISIVSRMSMHIYYVGVYKAGGNSILSSTLAHGIYNFIGTL